MAGNGNKVKFGGYFQMKKLVGIEFMYEDGTADAIIDPRACLLFQSRCNSNGLLSGMEDYIVSHDPDQDHGDTDAEQPK